MNWFSGFVNPALLWGVSLAAVPLVIHLLNRARHKPVRWAAMRFVLAAYKKTRRRVQLENLLLLFLRMAAIALLAFAIARPFSGEKSPLAGLTESRRDLLVLIDGSASMGYRANVETVFEAAVARARELVKQLEPARGDRVRLVLCGQYPRLLSWTAPDQALSMLDTLQTPTDEPLDLAAALHDVAQQVGEAKSGVIPALLDVRLLTDLQRRAFETRAATAAAGARGALYEELDRLKELGVRVQVEDLSGAETRPPNLGLENVAPVGPLMGPNTPLEVSVELKNFGPSAKNGVRVVLEVDGERRPNQIVDVPARGRAEALFPVTFKSAGEHTLSARLDEGDRLEADNERHHVVRVPAAVRVLLVNGAPSTSIDDDELGYLRAVIEPRRDDTLGAEAPFEAREIAPEELGAQALLLSNFDVLWIANVPSLAPRAIEALEKAVANGAALIVSLGERVDAAAWNQRAWRADNSGLLPAELKSVRRRELLPDGRAGSYFRVKSFDPTHPALSFFSDERFKPLLTEVPITAFVACRPAPNARVLATLDDEGANPWLVEKSYDRGKVFLLTSTIGPAWSRVAQSPATLVPLAHEWLRYAASRAEAPRNVLPGTPLSAEVAQFPRSLTLVRPDGTRRALDGTAVPQGGDSQAGRWQLPSVASKDTENAGLYKLEMDAQPALAFAVGMEPGEGDLERLSPREVEALHPAFLAYDQSAERDAPTPMPERGELWRPFAIAVFVVLVLESLWAAWLGRKRSVRA